MVSPRATAARQQQQQAGKKKARRRVGLRVRTDSWQQPSPRPHSALQGDELAISAITMQQRYPQAPQPEPEPEPEPEQASETQPDRQSSPVGAVKRRPPPGTPRVLTPNTAAAARRVSWGSNTSTGSVSSTSEGEGEGEGEIVAALPVPRASPCHSPRISASTHVPAIKGARWVREHRMSAERCRRHTAEVQALRSSAEEALLQRDLSRVQGQIKEERLRLSQERHSPPLRQAWSSASGEASSEGSEEAPGNESDTSCASSAISNASSCAAISSGSSGFTMHIRFKLPSRRGGGSARLALAAGEDAFSAAERFGREHSLRGPEVEKVRKAIETQVQRVEQRLRCGDAPTVEPPPDSAQVQAPAFLPAGSGHMTDMKTQPDSATTEAKRLQTWVSMTPEEVMEWRLLQLCKQRVTAAASPSRPVHELAQTFQSRWVGGAAAGSTGPAVVTAGAPPGMVLPPTPHRATYSPRVALATDYDSSDSNPSESDSDSDSASSEDEDKSETVSAIPCRASAESLRLSAEAVAATSQQQREPILAQSRHTLTQETTCEKADDPGAPVVRGKSINIGVEGATPKEVKDVSLARTPTKQVRNMGRYRRRASKAQAEAELHAKLQHYSGMLTAATHRRGHARHVIDLPAHVVAQYREKIAECQQLLAEMQPGYDQNGGGGTRFRPWFIGDVCQLVRDTVKSEGRQTAAIQSDAAGKEVPLVFQRQQHQVGTDAPSDVTELGRVEYVGTAPSLGRGVWVGLVLERSGAGEHDGTVGGRQYFSCEGGQGVLVRPEMLVPVHTPEGGRG